MRTISDLMNRSLIDVATGETLGHINGALVDLEARRVAALGVNTGLLHATRYLRWSDLRGVGPDVLTTPTAESLTDHKSVDETGALEDSINGRVLFTKSGERVGEVTDYRIDPETGALAGFDVKPTPGNSAFNTGATALFVPVDAFLTLGRESFIVHDDIRDRLRGTVAESQPS